MKKIAVTVKVGNPEIFFAMNGVADTYYCSKSITGLFNV